MQRDSRKAAGEEGDSRKGTRVDVWVRAGRSGWARRALVTATARARQLTTSLGETTIMLPRARLKGADGVEREWHSRIIPRYQWGSERVDGAFARTYLSGINMRRPCGALSPLLHGAPLSKDAASQV